MARILPFTREPIAFDPDALAIAIKAYDHTLAEFGSAPEVVRDVIAKRIIELMADGERDPKVLYDQALASAGIRR